ncbi:MAG: hypothetical protein K6F05_00160 [Succinivibrio sp.]|nr:hypothetical protein [Succinivibrio sp.]
MTIDARTLNSNVGLAENPQDVQQVNQGARQDADGINQEVGHAQRSHSGLSTLVKIFLTIGTGGLFGIYWGISSIVSYCKRSENQQPVNAHNNGLVMPDDEQNQQVNEFNINLKNQLADKNLPAEYNQAITDAYNELKESFPNLLPDNADQMFRIFPFGTYIRGEHLRGLLLSRLTNAQDNVTPQTFKTMVKEEMQQELTLRSLAAELKNREPELTGNLDNNTMHKVAVALYKSLPQAPAFNSSQEASALLNQYRDLAHSALLKQKVISGLESSGTLPDVQNLPKSHADAMLKVINELKESFGERFLPQGKTDTETLQQVLKLKIDNKSLSILLKEAVEEGKVVETDDFSKELKQHLQTLGQHYALENSVAMQVKSKYGLELNARAMPAIVNGLLQSYPDIAKELVKQQGYGDVAKLVTSDLVKNALQDMANEIKACEAKYLNTVSQDARPVFSNLIRSMQFDPKHRAETLKRIATTATQMKNWRKNIQYGDPKLNKFCDKFVEDLNANLKHLDQKKPGTFMNNINSRMIVDANRTNWSINGTSYTKPDANTLMSSLKSAAPNEADQQFLSSLANQDYSSELISAVYGSLQTSNQQIWRVLNQSSANEIKDTGFITNTFFYEGMLVSDRPNSPDLEKSYHITVSPDHKQAVVEFVMPILICTDDQNKVIAGKANLTMRVTCDLSAGAPDGKPQVSKVEVKQSFGL